VEATISGDGYERISSIGEGCVLTWRYLKLGFIGDFIEYQCM
jgi:hypothetical protein